MEWANALRSEVFNQVKGALWVFRAITEGEQTGFCCLGVGCKIAGVPFTLPPEDDENYGMVNTAKFGDTKHEGLPPTEFIDWLGLGPVTDAGGIPLYLDTGKVLFIRWRSSFDDTAQLDTQLLSSAALHHINDDWGLTFPQIGDLIAYFGVTLSPNRKVG